MFDFIAGVPGQMATLLSRLTATRATNLDNLDAAVSTRAAASTALSSATWTGTRAGYLDTIPTLPTTIVKSLQRGTVSTGWSVTSQTVTITAVNTAKAVLIVNGWCGGVASSVNDAAFGGVLTNSTTITLYRGSTNGTMTISWQVIEFN